MSKLLYPSDGIYKYCKDYAESCASNLSKAIADCNLDVPSKFTFKSYLDGLDNTLETYYTEINSINSKLEMINSNYQTLSSDLKEGTQRMVTGKIKERERMIQN